MGTFFMKLYFDIQITMAYYDEDPVHLWDRSLKQKISDGWETAKYTLQNTAIEIALLAILGTVIGTYNQVRSELRRSEKIPLAFSEIGAIERAALRDNTEVGPVTLYELKVNDMCMKIFEAYNEAQYPFIPGKNYEIFAWNIYNCMDLKNIYRYNLNDLLTQVPKYIPEINKKLETYKLISNNLNIANFNMDKAWEDSHYDNYHTEVYFTTDSKGNSTMHTRQVYDNTTHTYDYNKQYGDAGAKDLTKLFTIIPTVKLNEAIIKTKQTNADGEYAAEKSRGIQWKNRLTQEQLLTVANTWYTGSTILKNIRTAETLYPQLHASSLQWNTTKNTAHDDNYTTYSHSDAGPKEFQVAEHTLDLGVEINNNLKEMQKVINTTQVKVPLLEGKIKKFIEVWYVKYSSSEKEAKQLGDEILELTKEIYKLNFKEWVDVDRFRRGMIFLFALIGGIIGAGAGRGLDYLDNKISLYNRIKFKK